ncbi:MAG TPA: hypothetical protein DCE42_17675 [Myxococcales bacterium]|nr:hypothetical protein [Deltaproteobacteria bacterium]MBU52950.1 hypothetical protein [Deltaproteobacteria bacterium]HAA56598.1 hypothetical protein [Myxococcales bacterium]
MNEALFDNLKLWAPLVLITLVVLSMVTLRSCRLYSLRGQAKSHFLKACTPKHDKYTCQNWIYEHHDVCFDLCTELQRTGLKSSKYFTNFQSYEKCVYDPKAYKLSLRKRRRR